MLPITNYENIKIKIYSTSKGIKVVDSPIRIQILNILEDEVSESEIVERTNKSKSTISVHLRKLVSEGILSYRSHPMDRRSKLFRIVADYIGEIYPDKIIYNAPEVSENIDTHEQLLAEELKQLRASLLLHGLQIASVYISAGKNIGKRLYESFEYETIEELTELIKEKFRDLGLGKIKITSYEPLIFKNIDCYECEGFQSNRISCDLTKGILMGILNEHYDKEVVIEEVECKSKHDDNCTFVVD